MKWRIAAVIALSGTAAVCASSSAAIPAGASRVHVSVSPGTGSRATHFVVGFRATVQTGRMGSLYRSYRISATTAKRTGCQWYATVTAPGGAQGAGVRVTLAPGKRSAWCPGNYRGQVWLNQSVHCGPVQACPQIEIRPALVGTFTFRVAGAG
jgi:hypothetical protein